MFTIKHISKYKRGTNQYVKKHQGFAFKGYKEVAVICLFLIPVCYFGNQVAGQKEGKFVSPLPDDAYASSIKTNTTPVMPTPIPTKKDIIFEQKHGDIIYRIWGLESSFGQQPFLYCTRQGKVSDMGYNVLNHQCFDSFTQEVQTVEKWLEEHEGMKLGQELCLYNQGTQASCKYEENFLSL